MLRKKTVIVIAVTVITAFFFTLHYLLKLLPENEVKTNGKIEEAIYAELRKIRTAFRQPVQSTLSTANLFLQNIQEAVNLNIRDIHLTEAWKEANAWPSANQLVNVSSPNIGKILFALKHARIMSADVDTRGTQLKFLLTLTEGQQAVFKPKWYSKDKVIEGPVYAGKDRYGSEIVAFYLSVLLDRPVVPLSIERTISIKYDILPVATKKLLNTSLEIGNRSCIYGKCYYCRRDDPICDNEHNSVTGAVIFNIKKSFSNYRSPWQRTYKKGKKAAWEINPEYCRYIKTKLSKKRVFDLIDTAIFDFLIQNGDRHHYETLEDSIVWLDNGKGFGNPHVQHTDILAPLYQCCMVRKKTWTALQSLAGGNLSKYMKLMPDLPNLLNELHLTAMEERLMFIFATIEFCKKRAEV